MAKYRKKPVVIEAFKWGGEKDEDHLISLGAAKMASWEYASSDGSIVILTLEGRMLCKIGDYIIKAIKGEFYPCKPDIFEATYELVEE